MGPRVEDADVIRPVRLAHFVIRTPRFEQALTWWMTVLGAEARYQNDFIAFLTYDDEHHRLAIVSIPHLVQNDRSAAGLEHVAFTYQDLDALLATYRRLKALGIVPLIPINHGMTLSLYYQDPDGNQVELQVDAMNAQAAETFMSSDVFAANPIGVSFDPDDLLSRREQGESMESLLAYTPQ